MLDETNKGIALPRNAQRIKQKEGTYTKKLLQVPSRCNFPQDSQGSVDFIPQGRGEFKDKLLRKCNNWNLWR